MLSTFWAAPKPKIRIDAYQGVFHIRPPNEFEGVGTDDDPHRGPDETFWGRIFLSLPSPNHIRSLTITLSATYVLDMPGRKRESGGLYQRSCNVDVPLERMSQGEHSFTWSLDIPRSSAPYEQSQYGAIRHELVAVAEFSASDRITERALHQVVINPISIGETSVLNERIEDFNDEIGPYSVALTSPHLTVGGPLHFALALACCPPGGITIHSISGVVLQSYKLNSLKDGAVAAPSADERIIFHLDHATHVQDNTRDNPNSLLPIVRVDQPPTEEVANSICLALLPSGNSLKISHIARLPTYDRLQASTPESTQSPFHISHTFRMDLHFSVPGQHPPRRRVLHIKRPLRLLDCACMPASLVLPSYDDAVTKTAAERGHESLKRVTRSTGEFFFECTSLLSMNTLMDSAYFSPLLTAHEECSKPALSASDVMAANKYIAP
ncbi:hypothetical protein BKA62DRAFT_622992 [Auriculariales sp. MPI-PUGE-AT-0066]|nr:hypothetical protein BKA62DRAFT_622992 [Auriculariales sp. MPI-PUGE-AT-0066]